AASSPSPRKRLFDSHKLTAEEAVFPSPRERSEWWGGVRGGGSLRVTNCRTQILSSPCNEQCSRVVRFRHNASTASCDDRHHGALRQAPPTLTLPATRFARGGRGLHCACQKQMWAHDGRLRGGRQETGGGRLVGGGRAKSAGRGRARGCGRGRAQKSAPTRRARRRSKSEDQGLTDGRAGAG